MKKHWTQTRAGKKRVSELQTARWAALKNGSANHDEVDLMGQILESFSKLPDRAKDYVRARIS